MTVIAIIALASYVILFSSIIIPVSGQGEFNTLRISSVNPPIDIQGGDSVNIARNLASFQDSSFIILTQTNDQSIDDTLIHARIERIRSAVAENTGINDADFVNSDNNVIDQSNNQEIRDVSEESGQNRVVLSGLPDHIRIRTLEGSEASNEGVNNAEFHNSDNNDVSQSNDQGINLERLSIQGDLELQNDAENKAEFDNSDDNQVSQSNDQEIDDVKKGSIAENDAENSISLE